MEKTAIILGATGLTGGILLRELLENDEYSKLILFSRSSCGIDHPKIEEHLIDLFQLKEHRSKFKADEVFCCIGTTKSKTPDPETYRKIDYGIPVTAAELCIQNNITTYLVISAMGADSSSRIFYNKTKGEMEEAVLACKIPHTYILRPSLISGTRKESRLGENIAKQVMKVLDHLMIGALKKYRSIAPEAIVKAMLLLAKEKNKKTVIESDEIKQIAANYK
ncbi:NAD-dependent epimerase/dehydratase family protein [Salegentibacter chungangensis]|uniref:NAD-dependent epimerase/dehydratase family protein n=1 Tax=Salegentibacter chungangensis TaxID=1335724 RepID=A0ABW3NM20_9FLAO